MHNKKYFFQLCAQPRRVTWYPQRWDLWITAFPDQMALFKDIAQVERVSPASSKQLWNVLGAPCSLSLRTHHRCPANSLKSLSNKGLGRGTQSKADCHICWTGQVALCKKCQRSGTVIVLEISGLRGRDRGILGTCWPASLAQKASFRFRVRPLLKIRWG